MLIWAVVSTKSRMIMTGEDKFGREKQKKNKKRKEREREKKNLENFVRTIP